MSVKLDKTIKIQGLIRGLILGILLTAIGITYFYFTIGIPSPHIIAVNFVLFPYILPIGAATLLCFNLRKKIGGFWTMRQAVTGIFIMFAISYIIQFILQDQIFAKVIEPNAAKKTEIAMVSALNKLKASTTKPQEKKEADAKIDSIKKGFDTGKTIPISLQILFLGFKVIFLFVLAVAFASFFRRDPAGSTS